MTDREQGNRRTWQLWLLVALFFGPLALSMLMYYGVMDWRPGGHVNYGILLRPAVPMPPLPAGADEDLLAGHWTLVYVDGGACEDACREALYRSRQVRTALGRDMNRVRRVYLYDGVPPAAGFLDSEHPDLLVADARAPAADAWLAAVPGEVPADGHSIFLVDPHRNLVMRFPLAMEPKGMLKDLKKLLRVSRIG